MPACPHGALGRPHSVTAAGSRSLPAGGGLILDARILAWGAGAQDRPGPTSSLRSWAAPGSGWEAAPTSFLYIYYSPLFLILFVCVSVALYRVISLDTLYTSRFRTSMASPLLVIHPPP